LRTASIWRRLEISRTISTIGPAQLRPIATQLTRDQMTQCHINI
jgi:hypothetical protein